MILDSEFYQFHDTDVLYDEVKVLAYQFKFNSYGKWLFNRTFEGRIWYFTWPYQKIYIKKHTREVLTNYLQHRSWSWHKRSRCPEVFCEKGVLRNIVKFTGKHLCQSLFFDKVACLRPATLLKKRLWHRCFPMNFVKFLRTPSYIEHLWWLLLV